MTKCFDDMNILLLNQEPNLAERLQREMRRTLSLTIYVDSFDEKGSVEKILRLHSPDIVLLDILEYQKNFVDFFERLLSLKPQLRIVVFSSLTDYSSVSSSIRAGASSYITKPCSLSKLAEHLISVVNDGSALSPEAGKYLVREIQSKSLATSLDLLTTREKQVFECIEDGSSYKAMSQKLHISENTVHTHIKNIYSKLHAVNKHDALNKARDLAYT